MLLSLSAGDITQKGYEKKRSKLIGAYLPQTPGELSFLFTVLLKNRCDHASPGFYY